MKTPAIISLEFFVKLTNICLQNVASVDLPLWLDRVVLLGDNFLCFYSMKKNICVYNGGGIFMECKTFFLNSRRLKYIPNDVFWSYLEGRGCEEKAWSESSESMPITSQTLSIKPT